MKKSNIPASADEKATQDTRLNALNYPPSQDIMNQDERLDIDPESLPGRQTPYSTHVAQPVTKENTLKQQEADMGLDVPGAELDDTDEILGEEDEENNYYSLSDENDDQKDS